MRYCIIYSQNAFSERRAIFKAFKMRWACRNCGRENQFPAIILQDSTSNFSGYKLRRLIEESAFCSLIYIRTGIFDSALCVRIAGDIGMSQHEARSFKQAVIHFQNCFCLLMLIIILGKGLARNRRHLLLNAKLLSLTIELTFKRNQNYFSLLSRE